MAGLSCGATMAKYILFIFNFVFFLCGLIIFAVSMWLYFDSDAQDALEIIEFDSEHPFFRVALQVLIVVGAIIFVTSLLGCCGAAKESTTFLLLYAILLFIILIGQLVAAGFALKFRSQLDSKVEESMQYQAHSLVNRPETDSLSDAWHLMQSKLQCCGGESYQDYRGSLYSNETNNAVPESCCKLQEDSHAPEDYPTCLDEAAQDTTPAAQLQGKGCFQALKDWLDNNIGIVVGVLFGIIAIEILGIILACCIRKEAQGYKQV